MMSNMAVKRKARIPRKKCVSCGSYLEGCPRGAISIFHGCYAQVDTSLCVGCGLCSRECPAGIIQVEVIS